MENFLHYTEAFSPFTLIFNEGHFRLKSCFLVLLKSIKNIAHKIYIGFWTFATAAGMDKYSALIKAKDK